MRLARGSSDFLRAVAENIGPIAGGAVFSPALYPTTTRVWARAGFVPFTELEVLERPVASGAGEPGHALDTTSNPDWPQLLKVDRLAFEGFWRMSEAGLSEAMAATPRAVAVQARLEDEVAGYALVGAELNVSFLQRVAVLPAFSGRGVGASLLRGAVKWAGKVGTRTMVLNVRPDNERALRLYSREGFMTTGTSLRLLRFEG